MHPSTQPLFLAIVIFPVERNAMAFPTACTATPCNPIDELEMAAHCTSKADSNPAGSVRIWDTSHSFAELQSVLMRMAWKVTISIFPTVAVR